VSTVSLVLSGKGRISSATGERVNQAIEQLGFVRNRQAAAARRAERRDWSYRQRPLQTVLPELTAGLTDALESEGKMVFLPGGAAGKNASAF
jgi:LacI family transcriptional regulator of maltose regulon